MNLRRLRESYARGELARDDFWRQAQAEYRRAREHSSLPDSGVVKRIRAQDDALVVELADGLRMYWDMDDLRTAPNMLLNHGEYETRELAVLLEAARHAQVVFDVGANVGWYTLHLARAVARQGGHVHAFEPIPRTFAALEANVRLNALQSCTTLTNAGLGDAAMAVEFFLPRETGSVAASQRPLFEQQENERIVARVIRLDDYVADAGVRRLDLIKCDIEGAELLMLRGALESIRRFRPVIFLELLRKWSRAYGYHPNDVIALLAAQGYSCAAITDAGLEPMREMDDSCTATNFLFRPAVE